MSAGRSCVVELSEEARVGFGQMQSVSSHQVSKDASHLPKPNLAGKIRNHSNTKSDNSTIMSDLVHIKINSVYTIT